MSANLARCCLVASLLTTGCILPAGRPSVFGRQVKSDASATWTGTAELLAVTPDTIWVLKEGVGVVATPTSFVGDLRVKKHRFDGGKAFRIMALTGVASGVALGIACAQVEGGDCGPFVAVWMAVNIGIGGLLAFPMDVTSFRKISATQTETLRPFARYPQGLPDTVRAAWRP